MSLDFEARFHIDPSKLAAFLDQTHAPVILHKVGNLRAFSITLVQKDVSELCDRDACHLYIFFQNAAYFYKDMIDHCCIDIVWIQ